jgi:hypothetical protein
MAISFFRGWWRAEIASPNEAAGGLRDDILRKFPRVLNENLEQNASAQNRSRKRFIASLADRGQPEMINTLPVTGY